MIRRGLRSPAAERHYAPLCPVVILQTQTCIHLGTNDVDPFYSFLQVKCAACQEPLIRIAQSETDDRVVCPSCFAVGDYERVVKQGSGLSRGIFVSGETKTFIEQLQRRRDRLL